jgi:hypothetical protein
MELQSLQLINNILHEEIKTFKSQRQDAKTFKKPIGGQCWGGVSALSDSKQKQFNFNADSVSNKVGIEGTNAVQRTTHGCGTRSNPCKRCITGIRKGSLYNGGHSTASRDYARIQKQCDPGSCRWWSRLNHVTMDRTCYSSVLRKRRDKLQPSVATVGKGMK